MTIALGKYPLEKRAGVAGVDDIPTHWHVARLKTLARIRYGLGQPPRELRGGLPLIRATNIDHGKITPKGLIYVDPDDVPRSRNAFVKAGEIIVVRSGAYTADSAIVTNQYEGAVAGYDMVVTVTEADPRFISYVLLAPYVQEDQLITSSLRAAQPHLNSAELGEAVIVLPPLEEQAAIVRFLDHADLKIRRFLQVKRRFIEVLNEQKLAIINQAVVGGMNLAGCGVTPRQGGRSRRNQRGIPWLAHVPDHWDISPSKRLFSVRKELARPDDIQLSATQAYGVIPQAEFEEKVGRKVVRIAMHLEKRRHVEKDDFVISMRSFQGGLERAWAVGCIRSSYVVLKPASSVDVNFFAYLFKSHNYIQALRATANFIRDGQDLNFSNFCLVDLPLVPLDEQQAIAGYLDRATRNINVAMERAREEVKLLHEYRTRLIADIVTGKLDVREAAEGLSLSIDQEILDDEPRGLTDLDPEEADGLDDSSELLPVAFDED